MNVLEIKYFLTANVEYFQLTSLLSNVKDFQISFLHLFRSRHNNSGKILFVTLILNLYQRAENKNNVIRLSITEKQYTHVMLYVLRVTLFFLLIRNKAYFSITFSALIKSTSTYVITHTATLIYKIIAKTSVDAYCVKATFFSAYILIDKFSQRKMKIAIQLCFMPSFNIC